MSGKLTVVCGPMRSAKTLDIIGVAELCRVANKQLQIFHPLISSRWDKESIVSRLGGGVVTFPSVPLTNLLSFFENSLRPDTSVVIFDEVQFFGDSIVSVCKILRLRNIDVYVAGLDMDIFQNPFGPVPYLLAIADVVVKKVGVCAMCGEEGTLSYRQVPKSSSVENYTAVGDDEYKCMCLDCYAAKVEEDEISG